MKPLQSIAMGLVIIALAAPARDGYDVLPDPVGLGCWCCSACRRLPPRPAWGGTVLVAGRPGGRAQRAAVVPRRAEPRSSDADVSLPWAADLPQLVFAALLTTGLARAAAERRGPRRRPAGSAHRLGP